MTSLALPSRKRFFRLGLGACARLAVPLLALGTLSTLSGCVFGDLGRGIGTAFGCAFDLEGYDAHIDSDEDRLSARADCEAGSDCADVRTVARGASFDVILEIPSSFANAELRVESSDSDRLTLEGFAPTADVCDGGRELKGTATFDAVGEAAIVVYADDQEIDRFTATAYEPASLEIQASPWNLWSPNEWMSPETLAIDTLYEVRAIARSEDGARLIGAPAVHWSLPENEVASLGGSGDAAWEHTGPSIVLVPLALGNTTLHFEAGDFSDSIEVEVTAVPEPDAGTDDAGMNDAGESETSDD